MTRPFAVSAGFVGSLFRSFAIPKSSTFTSAGKPSGRAVRRGSDGLRSDERCRGSGLRPARRTPWMTQRRLRDVELPRFSMTAPRSLPVRYSITMLRGAALERPTVGDARDVLAFDPHRCLRFAEEAATTS